MAMAGDGLLIRTKKNPVSTRIFTNPGGFLVRNGGFLVRFGRFLVSFRGGLGRVQGYEPYLFLPEKVGVMQPLSVLSALESPRKGLMYPV